MVMPFHSDWMMSAMMPTASVAMQPPVATVSIKLPVPAVAQQPPVQQAAVPPASAAPAPFWNNFLVQSNFYRGSPLHSGSKVAVKQVGQTTHHHAMPKQAAVPQFAGMWHAFDAPVAFSAHSSVEPIGTPTTNLSQKKSMWSGTPVSSTKDDEEKWYNPFSLITPPVFKVVTKPATTPRMLASIDATSSDDEGVQEAQARHKSSEVACSTTQDRFKADDINSDDEDWLDHLRDTVSKVLSVAPPAVQDEIYEASEVVGVNDVFCAKKRQHDFDQEWSKLQPS